MLQPLGISAEAEALYVVLGSVAAATVPDLVRMTASDPDRVRADLEELRDLGLAAASSNALWHTLPLRDVVKHLKARRLSEIEMATAAAESLESHLLAASAREDEDIKILVGREAIVAAHRELLNSAHKEICGFDKPPYVEERADTTPESLSEIAPEWQAMDRGVSNRAVYHPGFDADRLAELALFAEHGEKSRTAPVPMKLIIVDAHTALIPSMRSYSPGHELRASLVRHPQLIEALQWLFEAVWETAVPIVTSFFSENDPRRQMLISLLMAGSTDNAIATQLGLNVRSVRRWISELMEELGVTTRLQLGAALVRAENLRATTATAPAMV
jgi:sugar-specific transcriptional regulator TrmB